MKLKRKILVFALTLAMTLQSIAFTGFAADDNTQTTYEAQIMNVKGGADAIATMTFDDGRHGTVSQLVPILEQYGLKASLMLVPYRIDGLYGPGYSNVDQLAEFLETGCVDIQSHSYSHLYMHDVGSSNADAVANNTAENINNEIPGSKVYLENAFPTQDIISIAVPGGNYSTAATEKMMETFYASRNKNGTASSAMQSLNPADTADIGGWYNLRNLWLKEASIDSIKAYLADCVNNGGWFITGCHDIVPANNVGSGNNDITPETLAAFFAVMQEYQNDGKLWVATFSDATKYIREVQNSTVKEYATDKGLFVELTMSETTERGQALPSDVFNYPLTVKVEIPDGWAKVRYGVGSNETIVDSFTESGKTYAYLDLVPNAGAAYLTDGEKEVPKNEVNAEIMNVKGGANAIATMTFDDGIMPTAQLLNTLFEEYDLRGSLMMITDRIGTSHTISDWKAVFSKGYLEPQSHSSNHEYIVGSGSNYKPENNTPENIEEEIVGSLNDLKDYFPDYDPLTYAVPYSNYISEAKEVLMQNYYAARQGSCVLASNSLQGKIQSLNPVSDAEAGGWYNPYMVRMQPISYKETNTPEAIVQYLERCIAEGGWFQGFTHGIAPAGTADTTGYDMTEEQARVIFSAMQYYARQGKLWVATYSEATKYLREWQNSTVSAYTTLDGMYVDVTMSETTKEGLPLDTDVFNYPLTVKLELPAGWGILTYSQNGSDPVKVKSFKEGTKTYAYIDVVPGAGTVSISNAGDPTEYLESINVKQNVTADSSLSYNLYIPTDSYVTDVYVDNNKVEGKQLDNGYSVYSIENIHVLDVDNVHNFNVVFDDKAEINNWEYSQSVVGYLGELVDSDAATDKDKQLVYDFLNYAKATYLKYSPEGVTPDTFEIDRVLEKLDGVSPSAKDYGAPSDLNTVPSVVYGTSFAINEKPYYMFYIKTGFTGKLTLTVGEGEDAYSTEYDVVNGYYHCKDYVIFEVKGVYDLISEVKISAEGKIGEKDVTAEGAYSLNNYAAGLAVDGKMPEYVSALYSYAVAAHNYRAEEAE